MFVYRAQHHDVETVPTLRWIANRVAALLEHGGGDYDAVIHLLIESGELASAVFDELHPHADDLHPAAAPWLGLVGSLASASDAVWREDEAVAYRALLSAARAAAACGRSYVPRQVARRVSEGFAYYALGPELYAEAARAWNDLPRGTPVVCVGLRTIGVTLAAAAAAGFASRAIDARTVAVRPRGKPFARHVVLTSRLEQAIRSWSDAVFVVVDEGPGLSGSSMACVADALSALGVSDSRIVMMPGHQPDVSAMNNEQARRRWGRHATLLPDFEAVWVRSGRLAKAFGADCLTDIGGGRWRMRCTRTSHAAVNPRHERRKFLADGPNGPRWIKFAGLGRYGSQALERARSAAAAGWGPAVAGFKHGWLAMPALSGCVLTPSEDAADPGQLARYLTFVKRTWGTGTASPTQTIAEMADHNVRVLCGQWAGDLLQRMVSGTEDEAVRVDGRQMPYEWIRTKTGIVKTDGIDHHDDHFFPGPVDIAWDVAGVLDE